MRYTMADRPCLAASQIFTCCKLSALHSELPPPRRRSFLLGLQTEWTEPRRSTPGPYLVGTSLAAQSSGRRP